MLELGMSVFIPSVAVDCELPGRLAVIAHREGKTVAALVRDILESYAEDYLPWPADC